jgi:LAO/AO transport system kinase
VLVRDKFRRLSSLADSIVSGDPRGIARGISLVENDADEGSALVRELFGRSGRAYLVGITGAPGAGKSTLVDGLVSRWRRAGHTVGVLAVDPTSPFSGGAMLGDRVRMQAHAQDAGVFIRSMATRGQLGGLARATTDAALVLDAAGKDLVAIETVGVGQDEVDIARTADVSVLVLVPGMGDEVQALKAGVMEIADVFVVNKADRDGADRTVAEVESLLGLHAYAEGEWRPTIVRTEATTGRGLDDVIHNIDRFRTQSAKIESRRRERAEAQLRAILGARLLRQIESRVSATEMGKLVDRIVARTVDPYSAVDEVLSDIEPRAARGVPASDAAKSGVRGPRDSS